MINLTEIAAFRDTDTLEKARHGRYADTAKNRRLHRVGQEYGSKKQDDPEADKKPKGQEEQPEQPKKERNGDSVKRELELLEEHKDSIVEKYGEKAYNKKVESLKKEGEDFEQKETVKELKERADKEDAEKAKKEDAEKAKKEEEKKKGNGPGKKEGKTIIMDNYKEGDFISWPNRDGDKTIVNLGDGLQAIISVNPDWRSTRVHNKNLYDIKITENGKEIDSMEATEPIRPIINKFLRPYISEDRKAEKKDDEKEKQQKDKNGISILEEGYSGDLTEVPNDGRKVLTAVDEDGRELAIFMNGRDEFTVANEYTTHTMNGSFYLTLKRLLRNFQSELNISDESLNNIVEAFEESFTWSDRKEAEKKKDWRPTKIQPYIQDGKYTKRDVRRVISEMNLGRLYDMVDNYPFDTTPKKELREMKKILREEWKRLLTGSGFDGDSKRGKILGAIEEFEYKIDAAL